MTEEIFFSLHYIHYKLFTEVVGYLFHSTGVGKQKYYCILMTIFNWKIHGFKDNGVKELKIVFSQI